MINSYIQQTKSCPLYISISYSEEMTEKVLDLVKKFEYYESLHFIVEGPKQMSQFTHYKSLIDYISTIYDSKSTYLIFSDDDDIWSKNRVLVYDKMIQNEYDIHGIYEPGFRITQSTFILTENNKIIDDTKISSDIVVNIPENYTYDKYQNLVHIDDDKYHLQYIYQKFDIQNDKYDIRINSSEYIMYV